MRMWLSLCRKSTVHRRARRVPKQEAQIDLTYPLLSSVPITSTNNLCTAIICKINLKKKLYPAFYGLMDEENAENKE